MPTAWAMVSAVLNPIPHTSAASRYGSLRTTSIEASAYCLKIRTASDVDTPTPWRKTITSLIAFCSSHAAVIFAVRFGPRPGDLDQPGRLLLDDPQGVQAEVRRRSVRRTPDRCP